MYKILKRVLFCLVLTALCWSFSILRDRQQLNEGLIRLHVVANSNSEVDQLIKLQVRDAILQSLQEDLRNITSLDEAKRYLQENISKIQTTANTALQDLGIDQKAITSFGRETFDVRHYDTFSLPAGVYDSLRIVIGEGKGKNWWCVAFPTLCIPATTEGFEAVAADAGLSGTLTSTLSHTNKHQIRFYFLDIIGKLENKRFSEK